MKNINLFIIFIFLYSCSSEVYKSETITNELSTVSESEFPGEHYFYFNQDSTCVLVTNKPVKSAMTSFRFFLYDLKSYKIIFHDNIIRGEIKWINQHEIKVTWTPGTVKGKEINSSSNGYIFDIKKKRKISTENKPVTE